MDSLVKHVTADPGIASSTSLTHQLKVFKVDVYWLFPEQNAPMYQCFGHDKEPGLFCVVGDPVSCTMGH